MVFQRWENPQVYRLHYLELADEKLVHKLQGEIVVRLRHWPSTSRRDIQNSYPKNRPISTTVRQQKYLCEPRVGKQPLMATVTLKRLQRTP